MQLPIRLMMVEMKGFIKIARLDMNDCGVFVLVRNNQVELRKHASGGGIVNFAQGAVSAVINGDSVAVTFKTGRVALYRVDVKRRTVSLIGNIS